MEWLWGIGLGVAVVSGSVLFGLAVMFGVVAVYGLVQYGRKKTS